MRRSRWWQWPLAYGIPLSVLLCAFYVRHIYPFGDTSVVFWDMNQQYVSYFGWLSDVLHGEANLVYSFGKGLGGNMLALVGYYLSSPFNILCAFFDASAMPRFFCLLTLIKLPFASLSCYAFLRRRYGAGMRHVILSSAWALCGWLIGECSNIMWIDGVIMLPLIVMGTEDVVNHRRTWSLFVTVACATLFNWYIAYMDCLFSLIVFVALERKRLGWSLRAAWRSRRKELICDCMRYAGVMLLGVAASAVLFLPGILALMLGKGGHGGLQNLIHVRPTGFPLFEPAFATIGSATLASDGVPKPMLYIAAIVVVPAVAWIFSSHTPKRERRSFLVVFFLVSGGLFLSTLDIIWSGMSCVTSFFFRYTFIVQFLLVIAAARGCKLLAKLDRLSQRRLLKHVVFGLTVAFLTAVVCVMVFKQVMPKHHHATLAMHHETLVPNILEFIMTLGALWVTALLLAFIHPSRCKDSMHAIGCGLVLIIFLAETACNTVETFGRYNNTCSGYESYTSSMRAIAHSLKQQRAEAALGVTSMSHVGGPSPTGESLVYGVRGVNHYSSTMESAATDFIAALGYTREKTILGTYCASSNPLADAMLGINYLVSALPPPAASPVANVTLPRAGSALYRNDLAGPLAYGISPHARLAPLGVRDNPFKNQERMLTDMVGHSADNIYVTVPAKEVSSNAAVRTLSFNVTQDGPLYYFLPGPNDQGLILDADFSCIAGPHAGWSLKAKNLAGRFNAYVALLGDFRAGDVLEVTLRLPYPHAASGDIGKRADVEYLARTSASDLIDVRTFDVQAAATHLQSLDRKHTVLEAYSDGHVRMSIDATRDEKCLIPIPVDPGWHATVDGFSAHPQVGYGALMVFDLSQGKHVIELTYTPPGLFVGAVFSVGSICVFCVWRLLVRRRLYNIASST